MRKVDHKMEVREKTARWRERRHRDGMGRESTRNIDFEYDRDFRF